VLKEVLGDKFETLSHSHNDNISLMYYRDPKVEIFSATPSSFVDSSSPDPITGTALKDDSATLKDSPSINQLSKRSVDKTRLESYCRP
jgi:hypothetical protein